ncbi:hypothetical protein D5R93_05715 [Actinomyces lilanjuaniae]|uniref:Phage major tail protein, phi13 family n=1 Tax=Actinomyces lilanjuaniae TaxID=2321394 RepID=A0ABM6Z3H4_9ACTO|nr:hypothetical protein [Actinomyces lilanjuaniae]AYD89669.1 hypothetical protein D5R93_05715 [Actinomyces lilanjuaniae]
MAPTFDALKTAADNRNLVRKTKAAIMFLAPTTADMPEDIMDGPTSLRELDEAWWPVGLVTPDGYTFGSDTSKEEVEALGYIEPVRTDITKVAKSIQFTAYETLKRNFQQLIYGVDLSTVTQDAASGAVVFDEMPVPDQEEFRALVVSKDGPASDQWLVGRGYPLVKLAEVPEETWNSSDAVQAQVTLDIFTDPVLGTPAATTSAAPARSATRTPSATPPRNHGYQRRGQS